jgi:prolyl 4-hydroxylase
VNYAFKGAAGDALMFGNVSETGEPELLSMHEGRPPTSGEKWLLSQWVRNRPMPSA